MKNLKRCVILTCSVLLALALPMLAQAQLLGHWTFDDLSDSTGNFGDLELMGATVSDGMLSIGDGTWAITTGYSGPDITEKTLVAWLYLDDLDVKNGAPLGINKSSGDSFDAIVYAEREEHRWMAGSSNWSRTDDAVPGFEETETGVLIKLAVSYGDDGNGQTHVMIYRNDDLIGDYVKGAIATWVAGDTEAIFGPRAIIGGNVYGWVVARVEEARIYGEVLSSDTIAAVTPGDKLTTSWGAMKAQ